MEFFWPLQECFSRHNWTWEKPPDFITFNINSVIFIYICYATNKYIHTSSKNFFISSSGSCPGFFSFASGLAAKLKMFGWHSPVNPGRTVFNSLADVCSDGMVLVQLIEEQNHTSSQWWILSNRTVYQNKRHAGVMHAWLLCLAEISLNVNYVMIKGSCMFAKRS